MSGVTRQIKAELADKGNPKDEVQSAFSAENIENTKPENYRGKKARAKK